MHIFFLSIYKSHVFLLQNIVLSTVQVRLSYALQNLARMRTEIALGLHVNLGGMPFDIPKPSTFGQVYFSTFWGLLYTFQ